MAKNLEEIDVFWDLDLEGILGGFGEGFGKPKTSIFALWGKFLERLGRRERKGKKEENKRGKRGTKHSTVKFDSWALPV